MDKALASVRESLGVSFLTSATIAVALFVVGLFILSFQNIENLALVWGRAAAISLYIDESIPKSEWEELRKTLEEHPSILRAEVIRPEDALERFRARGEDARALVEGVGPEILPPTIDVHLEPSFADLDKIKALANKLEASPQFIEVDYGQQEFDQVQRLLDLMRLIGLAAGFFIALATIFIVSNTIRLTVYARRDEIGILRLVGATRFFVRAPFLLEGVIWGFWGGSAASLGLWGADLFVAPLLSELASEVVSGMSIILFTPSVGAGLILGGVLLGIFGSSAAVSQFLDKLEET